MKVTVKKQEERKEDEVVIYCSVENRKIKKIKGFVENMDYKLWVTSNEENVMVDPDEVYYFESVDKRTFVYLKEMILECPLRLYEIELKYKGFSFFRATKSTIVNTKYIRKVVPMLNRNLMVTLKNKEKLIISRRNIKEFKILIGWE